MIEFKDVFEAKNRIDSYVKRTPLVRSIYLSDEDTNVYFKFENQQNERCAKLRGAFSKLTSLSKEEIDRGISAISSGNHGIAVSYASSVLGYKNVKIYIPKTTPQTKVDRIASYGVEVVQIGENYDEVYREAKEIIKSNGEILIDSGSDVEVISGQGTVGIEIVEELKDVDQILVPIGSGGTITGISVAAKVLNPKIKIIGVQTEACPAMVAAMRDKVFYEDYESDESICDALIGGVGEIPYLMAEKHIDEIIVVSEDMIREGVKYLVLEEKTVAEAAAAITVGAVLQDRNYFKGKNTVAVITGGNIDSELLREIISE